MVPTERDVNIKSLVVLLRSRRKSNNDNTIPTS